MNIQKTVVGQNVNVTIEVNGEFNKYTKKFTDKEEKAKFVAVIVDVQTSIEKAKSDKAKLKHIDGLIKLLTVNTKEAIKKEENDKAAIKAVEKKVKKESKKKEKLPSKASLEALEKRRKELNLEGEEIDKAINKLKGNEKKVEAVVSTPSRRREGEY